MVSVDLALDADLADAEHDSGMPLRYLVALLPTIADREGRLSGDTRRIRAQLLAFDREPDVEKALDHLERLGHVQRYQGPGGEPLLQLSHFTATQRVHPREAESTLPPPPRAEVTRSPAPSQGGHGVDLAEAFRTLRDAFPGGRTRGSGREFELYQMAIAEGADVRDILDAATQLGDDVRLGVRDLPVLHDWLAGREWEAGRMPF